MVQSLLQELIEQFNQEGIVYCHWKSNVDLAKTMEGELDIDLLVSIQSLARATSILMQLGFKAATPRWGANPAGVFHFYGYDPNQEDLVHLHLFTHILTGESFLKSHLFPFEEMMLNNVYAVEGIKVTSKEAELVLFVQRMFIKYGSFLDAMRLLKSDKKVRQEAMWLKEGSDMSTALLLLGQYCPVISEDIFLDCLNALLDSSSFVKKWILSLQVRRSLKIYRKYSFWGTFSGHFQLLLGMLVKKVRRQKGSKIMLAGGTIISIVGPDATGKSTTVSETSRWLRKNFVVNTIHAGKPPTTLLTAPVNLVLARFRKLKRRPNPDRSVGQLSTTTPKVETEEIKGLGSLIYAIRAVSLAWDRRVLLLKARRAVANGEIVVSDRYPTFAVGMMDSPRLRENPSQKGWTAAMYNRLARIEQGLYRQIPPPDIVVRLNVSLEIAKKRNASREIVDDEVYLQNRHQQARAWFMDGTRTIQDINTDASKAETLRAVKQAIWPYL